MSELSVGQLRGLTVNDNVISMPSGHKLYAPGSVVQVVSASTSTTVTTTSSSFITTGLSASITPLLASSKIAVTATTSGSSPDGNTVAYWALFRGTVAGTNLAGTFGSSIIYLGTNALTVSPVSCIALDSPGTTSPQTYTLGFRSNGTAAGVVTQRDGCLATITLMEIAQ